MAWWEILVGILLFIVALGVLIGIHELGHLSAAKMFNVYCFNYSIGFGPKLISSKRTKKHETIWTLRAIPLGGFVSMYGEGAELDTDEYIPPNRSLEGIARYKRAIIVSAGVFLNFILGFVLILLHNGCFDQVSFRFPAVEQYKTAMVCSINQELAPSTINDGDKLKLQMDPFNGVFLIDEGIAIDGKQEYVLCMSNIVTTTKIDPLLSDSLVIYKKKSIHDVVETSINNGGLTDERLASFIKANGDNREIEDIVKVIKTWGDDKKRDTYHIEGERYFNLRGFDTSVDISKDGTYNIDKNTPNIDTNFTFYDEGNQAKSVTLTLENNGGNKFKDCGIYMKRFFYHYNAGECFKATWDEWCGANTAVFRGLGMLFTGQGEVSGPIGIAKMSTTALANFGFERYLYLWGMISCNLAILNLLPFPGLDGWALVVIAYEAIRKKQIPTKVKSIISVIGLGLLFLLMIFIIIKDVLGLIVV